MYHYPAVARQKVHLFRWNHQCKHHPLLVYIHVLSLAEMIIHAIEHMKPLIAKYSARALVSEVATLLWGVRVPTRLPWPASPSLLRSPSRRLWLHPQRACCSGASPVEEIGALQFHWTKKERQRCINTDPTNRYCAIMENQDLGAKLSPTLWYEYWKKIKPCRKRTARPG